MENMVNTNFWKNKKVLVTGHTGFKGSWLVFWLAEMGADVYGIALPPQTNPSIFSILKLQDIIKHIELDITQYEDLLKAVKMINPEIIIHMAAQSLVKESYRDPLRTYNTNIMGTVHLLEIGLAINNLKVFINVTSDKCYQNNDSGKPFVETDPMGGHDPYSNSKGCVELITESYRSSFYKKKNIQLASVRAGNVIGGGDWSSDRLIPDLIKAFSSGKKAQIRNPCAVRPWQHVLDPLNGYLMLAERCCLMPSIYNSGWNFGPDVADAQPVSKIVDYVAKKWGACDWQEDITEHKKEAELLCLNTQKSREVLGWSPRFNLNAALDKTIEWYKSYYSNNDLVELMRSQINEMR